MFFYVTLKAWDINWKFVSKSPCIKLFKVLTVIRTNSWCPKSFQNRNHEMTYEHSYQLYFIRTANYQEKFCLFDSCHVTQSKVLNCHLRPNYKQRMLNGFVTPKSLVTQLSLDTKLSPKLSLTSRLYQIQSLQNV